MKLSYKFLNTPDVSTALNKMETCGRFMPTMSLRVGRLCRQIREKSQDAQNSFIALLKTHSKLDPSGLPMGLKTGEYEFETPEKKELFNKEFDELMKTEFNIHLIKLGPKDLMEVGLTPREMLAIEDLVDID